MSFDLTDLHTLIVRAHDRHRIPIGKAMRVTLQAAANHKFPLYQSDGSRLEVGDAERDVLRGLAAIAEQQNETRWWTKDPWFKLLPAVLVPESRFWEWLNSELGQPEDNPVVAPASELGPPQDDPPAKRTERRRDRRIRAKMAVDALWPERVPDPSILPNGPLCKKVNEWLKKDCEQQNISHVPISDDTILRAAGRR
jgi:hypothetical protein